MHRRITTAVMALAAVTLAAGLARTASAQHAQAFPQPGGAVLIAWIASPNPAVAGYNVYRNDVGVAADKAVLVNPTPTTGTTLLDMGPNNAGLPLGKPLSYTVRTLYKDASGNAIEGSTSGPAVVTPQNPTVIPAGSFFYYDIHTPHPGSVTVEGNVLTIRAAGHDLWDGNDGQTFLAMPMTGNYQITARLNEQPTLVDPDAGNPWAKIGVQIRAGLNRGDPFGVAYASVERDPEVMYEGHKSFFSGIDNFSHGGTGLNDTTFPVYLRLVKQGATITAFQSFDNSTYTQIGDPQDYGSLPPVTYVGIVLGSSRQGQYAIGKFAADSIKIEPK
jgi:hypothetical protein